LTRINPEGLKALRQLALDRDTTVQALMIEAANDLLRKYKRRPVAQTAPRSWSGSRNSIKARPFEGASVAPAWNAKLPGCDGADDRSSSDAILPRPEVCSLNISRFQKDSALARWYRTRTEGPSGARKTTMIVALARKLLIALWRLVTTGEVPDGVELRPAAWTTR
jgi:hypothetical protein